MKKFGKLGSRAISRRFCCVRRSSSGIPSHGVWGMRTRRRRGSPSGMEGLVASMRLEMSKKFVGDLLVAKYAKLEDVKSSVGARAVWCSSTIRGASLTFGVLARGLRSRGLFPSPAQGWRGRGRRGAVGLGVSMAWESVTYLLPGIRNEENELFYFFPRAATRLR